MWAHNKDYHEIFGEFFCVGYFIKKMLYACCAHVVVTVAMRNIYRLSLFFLTTKKNKMKMNFSFPNVQDAILFFFFIHISQLKKNSFHTFNSDWIKSMSNAIFVWSTSKVCFTLLYKCRIYKFTTLINLSSSLTYLYLRQFQFFFSGKNFCPF